MSNDLRLLLLQRRKQNTMTEWVSAVARRLECIALFLLGGAWIVVAFSSMFVFRPRRKKIQGVCYGCLYYWMILTRCCHLTRLLVFCVLFVGSRLPVFVTAQTVRDTDTHAPDALVFCFSVASWFLAHKSKNLVQIGMFFFGSSLLSSSRTELVELRLNETEHFLIL